MALEVKWDLGKGRDSIKRLTVHTNNWLWEKFWHTCAVVAFDQNRGAQLCGKELVIPWSYYLKVIGNLKDFEKTNSMLRNA